jgi:hypothetical protein
VTVRVQHEQAEIVDYLTTVYEAQGALRAHPLCARAMDRARETQLDRVPAQAFTRLNLWRTRASDTLRHGDAAERGAWDRANELLARLLAEGEPVGFAFGAKLHRALGFADSSVRTDRLYTADEEYLKPAYVPEELRKMDHVLESDAEPLLRAFVALVAMVTIHPFSNGNGRSSRLLADAVLISEGFLPLSFAFPIASHVGRTTRGVQRTVTDAIETFLMGLNNSYDVIGMTEER